MGVTRMFVMPDGSVKSQDELSNEEFEKFRQKVADLLTPLIYEHVLYLHRQECAATNS